MDNIKAEQLAFANNLLFETPGGYRFTQDSPILPNVWLAFAAEPYRQHELILTTTQNGGAGYAASKIREMLNELRSKKKEKGIDLGKRPRIAYIPGQIAVRLYFDELMRVVLPLTPWWHRQYRALRDLQKRYGENASAADWVPFPQPDETTKRETDFTDALMVMRRDLNPGGSGNDEPPVSAQRLAYIRGIPPEITWLVRIAGLLADCYSHKKQLLSDETSLSSKLKKEFLRRDLYDLDQIEKLEEQEERVSKLGEPDNVAARKIREDIVGAFTNLYDDWSRNGKYPSDGVVWRITKNRPVKLAVSKSALTVKADAAVRLFDISCEQITWAIVDSGIDQTHPAFKLTSSEYEQKIRRKKENEAHLGDDKDDTPNSLELSELERSRVVKTLDFTRLRELLDYDIEIDMNDSHAAENARRIKGEIARRLDLDTDENPQTKAEEVLEELRRRISDGKDISWQDLELAIVDNHPRVPTNDHGTHVAGILGADWIEDYESEHTMPLSQRTRKMRGVCPDINLIDVRVFREDGLTDEFELLAAMQYLRWMNSRAGTMQVHGANLSLSLIHEVRRFACGRTPICEECDESVALGMVVVAAAGNRGFEMTDAEQVRTNDGYRSVSITDPGNAESVITVGATHRKRPHEYGVSYFSSRGPTGDGRLKPDIVAPGEKIKGPTPQGRAEYKDGTSMAAPHVSGAAALLMARHSELIAQPERIKSILCNTATDLGRERYFQGHGLVDILRALQSV